jgi:Lrp/AsnC family leucine-responsive transcriptional regulator
MIDETDKKLISLLEVNALQSSYQLAKLLHISAPSVRRRKKKLISDGLLRILASTNPYKLGLGLAAIILIVLQNDHVVEAEKKLSNHADIRWVSSVKGRYNLVIFGWFQNTEMLEKFIREEVETVRGIKQTDVLVCIHLEKRRPALRVSS